MSLVVLKKIQKELFKEAVCKVMIALLLAEAFFMFRLWCYYRIELINVPEYDMFPLYLSEALLVLLIIFIQYNVNQNNEEEDFVDEREELLKSHMESVEQFNNIINESSN